MEVVEAEGHMKWSPQSSRVQALPPPLPHTLKKIHWSGCYITAEAITNVRETRFCSYCHESHKIIQLMKLQEIIAVLGDRKKMTCINKL